MVERFLLRLFPQHALGKRFAYFTAKMFAVFISAMLVLFAAIFVWIHSTYVDITELRTIETRISVLQQAMVDQQTGLRGYQLTGSQDFLQTFHQGSEQFASVSQKLGPEVADDDNMQLVQSIGQMIVAGNRWHDEFGAKQIEAPDVQGAITATDRQASKDSFDQFRKLAADARQLVAQERQDRQSQMLTLIGSVAVGACLLGMFLATLVLGLIIRKLRDVVQPIEDLTVAVAAYAEQNFSVPVPEVEDDEIGQLVRSVDIMRQKLESSFHASEEKYRLIAENMTDMIRLLDRDGVVQYASPSHKIVLGYPPEAIEGHIFLQFVHEEDHEGLREQYAEAVRGKTSIQWEIRVQHRDGHYITMETHGTPVFDEEGGVQSFIVICRDITERKRTDELLRKSDKLSVVGELAAGIGHEIRNPLTAIRGFVQLLGSQPENKWYAEVILSEVDRLNEIVGEFMLLAKPQQQAFRDEDPRHIVELVLTLLNSQALLYNVRFVVEFDEDVPPIHCEVNQLKQVFINLIKNAIEAMPGGGDLLIQVQHPQPDRVVVRFVDQGCGIPEELIHRIGEPFYTTKEKGTGLGLMMCFRIIESHHGIVQIESELNFGTTIELSFPVYAEASPPNPLYAGT